VTYTAALRFLDGLVNYERQAKPRNGFKLDNIRRLLELAGDPQQRLRNVVLIAGTKGKGSTCYLLDAALRGCGMTTGLFLSPHVLDVRERIQLDGRPIPKRTFARLVSRLAPFVFRSPELQPATCKLQTRVPVSYFEFATAMMFTLFADAQPDYSIVEVGLGGRLDATNLCEPDVSVITRIGFDHLNVLGNTLTEIAGEKAGIMRRGRPVVVSEQEPEALVVLKRKARAAGARLIRSESVASVSSVRFVPSGLRFRARGQLGAGLVRLPLLGRHQVENCRTALAVLGELSRRDPRIRLSPVLRGLKTVSIPARCQLLRSSLLFPPSSLLLVDSCHNPESGRALANILRDHLPLRRLQTANGRLQTPRVVLIYGSLSGKLVERTVAPLAPCVHHAILVQPDSPRAMPLAELSRIFKRLRIPHATASTVRAALALARRAAQAQAQAQAPGLQTANCKLQTAMPVVVAGSFYLAGDALRILRPARA
jgi:dihydrofolate synthase/folylpolyglutamate synthase